METPEGQTKDADLKKHLSAIERLMKIKSQNPNATWNQLFWAWVDKYKQHGCVSTACTPLLCSSERVGWCVVCVTLTLPHALHA